MSRQLTLVAIGDDRSEKTDLLVKYTYDKRRYKRCMPSRFTNNYRRITVDDEKHLVYFMDTCNDEDYLRFKKEAILLADCILYCYSIKCKASFENLCNSFVPQVRLLRQNVPCIVVGTGTEARGKSAKGNSKLVSFQQGDNLRSRLGARSFVECSVQHDIGVEDVFIEAVRSTYDFHKYLYYSM